MLMIQGACYPRVTPVIIKFSHSLALFPEHSLLSGGLLRMDLLSFFLLIAFYSFEGSSHVLF